MDSIFSKLQSVTENYSADLSDMSIVPKKTVEQIKILLKDRDLTRGENIEDTLDDLLPCLQKAISMLPIQDILAFLSLPPRFQPPTLKNNFLWPNIWLLFNT